MDVPVVDLGWGLVMPITTLIDILLALIAFFILENIAIRFITWDVTWPWLKAWLYKTDISLEYTKSRQFKFDNPTVDKSFPDVWQLDKQGDKCRPIVLRREGFGIGPHKVRMAVFTSEFTSVVSPIEMAGKHYFEPSNVKFVDENGNEVEDKGKYSRILVEYPTSILKPSEFVQYQQINVDPSVFERFASYKALDVAKRLTNPINALMSNPQFMMFVITLLIGGSIAYMWLSNNNAAVSCNEHIKTLYETGQCTVQAAAQAARNISTGVALR